MPPEVVARLDETLAGLVAERQVVSAKTPSNVVPLRRRWASRAAAAAAAVIVVGAGGVAVANLDVFSGSNGTADSAAGGGGSAAKSESLDSSTDSPRKPAPAAGDLASRLPRITAASFDAYASRLVQTPAAAASQDSTSNRRKAARDGALAEALKESCPGPRVGDRAATRPVLYDGSEAVLVIHPQRGGQQLVEAWTCTGDRVLDRTRVAVPLETSGQSTPGNPGLGSPTPTP